MLNEKMSSLTMFLVRFKNFVIGRLFGENGIPKTLGFIINLVTHANEIFLRRN